MVFASSSAGLVGDGSSVGTGISVGEFCPALLLITAADVASAAEERTCGISGGEGDCLARLTSGGLPRDGT